MDISGLANITTGATTLSNLILVSPQKTIGYQPQKFPSYKKDVSEQDPAFLFHFEDEQTLTLESDVTDHVLENNEVVNDQISLKPEVITTRGFIGELNDVPPKELKYPKLVANKLVAIGAYAPQISETALNAYNEAAFIASVGANAVNSAAQTLDAISGQGQQNVLSGDGAADLSTKEQRDTLLKAQNKQQRAFQQFYAYWKTRTLFTIQTPWAVFQDCAIMRVHAVQDGETDKVSSFEVTFKVLRFAKSSSDALLEVKSETSQGRASNHAAPEQDLGTYILKSGDA